MAVRKILVEGDPVLRAQSLPVKKFDATLRSLVDDMWETMYAANGVGLAAPQIGLKLRLIVIDVPENMDYEGSPGLKVAMANPIITQQSGTMDGDEGCLSIPGWYGNVQRMAKVTMEGLDLDGKKIKVKAEGYCARACQHEVDHLNGKLFMDRMTDARSLHYVAPRKRAAVQSKPKETASATQTATDDEEPPAP